MPVEDIIENIKELSIQQWKEIIKECKDYEVGVIRFTGGEPLVKKGIEELFIYCNEIQMPFQIETKVGTRDLNGDGKMDSDDAWGYVARSNDVLPGFWVGGGVTAAEKDSEDLPYNTMGSERFMTVIDKIFDIIHGNGIYYDSFGTPMFVNGNVIFNDITLHQLQNLRTMDTDFGILPYPKLDEKQEKYYMRLGGNTLFCTLKAASKEDLERTSVILEAMACESLKTCVPAYYDLMLKTKLARDVESEEIIDYIVAHRVIDLIDNLWVSEIRDGPLNDMFRKKSNTLASLNEKLEPIFNRKRDSMVKAFLELD